MANCPETRALTSCLPLLDSGLNPDEVTNKLLSGSVITARDKEKINSKLSRYEKVNELTTAVGTNLATNPGNFWKFVGILRTVSSYANLASALEDECIKQGGGVPRREASYEGHYPVSAYPVSPASVPVYPSPYLPPPRPSPYVPPVPEPVNLYQNQSQHPVDWDGPPEENQQVLQYEGVGGERVYNVTTRKFHALAVILNNETFQCDLPNRPESEHDVVRLWQVLDQNLGFEVVAYKDLTSQQIMQLFGTKIDGRIQRRHDSFFCCIMSHGAKAGICGTDGKLVSTTSLMECLDGNRCPELVGKPKIMIIHCCRGPRVTEPVYKAEGPSSPMPISPHSDFICGYSTVEGDITTRGANGAPYIQILCEVLRKNDRSLNEMLCAVNRRLRELGVQQVEKDGRTHNFVQTGQVEHTLQEFVFFRPA